MQHLMNFKELDTREYIDENDFHKNIILKNSKPLTKKEREKTQAMLTILSTINNREYFVYFDDTDELMYIKSLYEMSIEKEFTKEKEQTYLAFREFMGNLPFYTKDEDIIHLIITKMPTSSFIYNTLKMSSYINERDEKVFTKYRLPILNILLYLLKNGLFEQYYNFIRDLEMDVISIFYNTYEEEIKSAIKKYYSDSTILYLSIVSLLLIY